ncbi:MAG: sulfatase [Acidimicrobiales bacterium]|nr:sulfatase [Acidimicrobiales bacterium]
MRLLFIDIDTLRPDHLSCYGYPRTTSPCIDEVARDGIRFDQMHVSDSPCLPSRSALVTCRFGFSNGVINHGGERAEPYPGGASRPRRSRLATESWPSVLQATGMWCASISTFGERHSAFHWYSGFNEVHNLGTDGMETADQVARVAIEWLTRNGAGDSWFLHVHFWDPHTPYRTPAEYGNPLAGQPPPGWIDQEIIDHHRRLAGPHSAQEVTGWGLAPRVEKFPRQPHEIVTTEDARRMFDGYDVGVHYVDRHVGRLLETIETLGIRDETAILVSSDHGENLGELGIYCDHQTADQLTHRVPLILCWPGIRGGRVDRELRYQFDAAATVAELVGAHLPADWDGHSFAGELTRGLSSPGRDHLVLSAAAWATQRSVRFDRWLCIRTYHDAFHDFPGTMLFDIEADPTESRDVAEEHPQIVAQANQLLADWETSRLAKSTDAVDPISTVLAEGGGYYTRGRLVGYLERLRQTGREDKARLIEAKHADRLDRVSRLSRSSR